MFVTLNGTLQNPKVRRMRDHYRRIFSVGEIERNVTLQWYFGALLLYFLITFNDWITSPLLSTDAHAVCWPYFLNCNALHFFSANNYSQATFYIGLFSVMLLVAYCMYMRAWTSAHALMLVLFLWKLYASFVLSWGIASVPDYYHLILTAAILFVSHKEYFSKLLFVLLYFLSSTIKFYPTWVLGTYFTTLKLGLPLFPDSLTALITNSVIFEQVIGCWFLLSRNRTPQRLTLWYFILFHLYGGILVLYDFSIVSLTTLLVLFGPRYRHQYPPLKKSAIAGWVLVAMVMLFQTPVHFIPGDEKMTMEGQRFGMWMFDANHQCISDFTVYYEADVSALTPSSYVAPKGTRCDTLSCVTARQTGKENGRWVTRIRVESPSSEMRCSPYTSWQSYLFLCGKSVERVAFTFDHSVNGEPFYRIVDVPDMCGLTFKTFGHNEWIHEPPEAPAIGYPVENIFY